MKQILRTTSLILIIVSLFALVSCAEKVDATGLWENATYLSDTTVGKGEKTVTVTVVAGEQSITLTVKTDKDTLGEALYENGIINDASFFDTCNGIKADWSADQAWWAFKQSGEMLNYGVNDAKISGGENFTIEYTK